MSGRTPLIFLPEGVKVNAQVYRERVLEAVFLPWAHDHFADNPYTFQQDSGPSHKARVNQEWLHVNTPAFITTAEWPPYSPDLNPMDFCIWGYLQSKVSSKQYQSLDALKRALLREWDLIPQDVIRACCEAFAARLRRVVRAKGGYIET